MSTEVTVEYRIANAKKEGIDSGTRACNWVVICLEHSTISPGFTRKKDAKWYVEVNGVDWCEDSAGM